jgi:hypothetical protein
MRCTSVRYTPVRCTSIGIGEHNRLKDRQVRPETGFEVRETIIMDFQVWLRLPMVVGGSVTGQWKKPDIRKKSFASESTYAH